MEENPRILTDVVHASSELYMKRGKNYAKNDRIERKNDLTLTPSVVGIKKRYDCSNHTSMYLNC